jgi:hypothetical protein
MKKPKILFLALVFTWIMISSFAVKAQEFGRYGLGFQRAIWTLWGPSVIVDVNRHIGFETIVGVDFFSNTNSNIGAFERLLVRPIKYKTNSLYIAGMLGTARWHYMGSYGSSYISAYEWGLQLGLMGGAELDLRLLFPGFIPLFINVEGGLEHRETKYTTSNTYPTYGFGIHYRI